MLFRIELNWRGNEEEKVPPIYLVADGSIILQGRDVPKHEREAMHLPAEGGLIRVDRALIKAIKEML
ncbi:MAG: hypothetical protein ACOY5F_13160 [Pseudomonadota bacterium]